MSDQKPDPIFPPIDQDTEATDSNPVPLSPTDPKRRTSAGDTNPTDQAGIGGFRAVVAPQTAGGGSGVGGVGIPGLPLREEAEPLADDGVLRPDSEGAV